MAQQDENKDIILYNRKYIKIDISYTLERFPTNLDLTWIYHTEVKSHKPEKSCGPVLGNHWKGIKTWTLQVRQTKLKACSRCMKKETECEEHLFLNWGNILHYFHSQVKGIFVFKEGIGGSRSWHILPEKLLKGTREWLQERNYKENRQGL